MYNNPVLTKNNLNFAHSAHLQAETSNSLTPLLGAGPLYMKHLTAIAIFFTALAACTGSKQLLQAQAVINKYGTTVQLTDTFLLRLQQDNDLVLANAVEHTAWGHNITWQIIARKNGQWTGYSYKILSARGNQIQQDSMVVAVADCNNALLFFTNGAAWETVTGAPKCNTTISDGGTWYLLMLTPAKQLRSKYYEPAFYQQHCPDSTRQAFLDAFNKLNSVFGEKNTAD